MSALNQSKRRCVTFSGGCLAELPRHPAGAAVVLTTRLPCSTRAQEQQHAGAATLGQLIFSTAFSHFLEQPFEQQRRSEVTAHENKLQRSSPGVSYKSTDPASNEEKQGRGAVQQGACSLMSWVNGNRCVMTGGGGGSTRTQHPQ